MSQVDITPAAASPLPSSLFLDLHAARPAVSVRPARPSRTPQAIAPAAGAPNIAGVSEAPSVPDIELLPTQIGLFEARPDPWARRWRVASRSGAGASYVVALHAGGWYGCTCKGWIFQLGTQAQHRDCHHIQQVKARVG